MLTYIQIHLYYVIPPIITLGLLYGPLIGRRDIIKVLWLGLMATLWTTPWDNFILSHSGWSYPPNSVLVRIGLVPIEEHLFFILQPILLILLHCICAHTRLLPFDIKLSSVSQISKQEGSDKKDDDQRKELTQTLPRRPVAAALWGLVTLVGLGLVFEAHGITSHDLGLSTSSIARFELGLQTGLGQKAFYLGWILVWISPVIGWLTYLGARLTKADMTALWVGTIWLWMVDTVALRGGSWAISKETTLGLVVWRGLPVEEALFFLLTSHLIILSSSLISHLHSLLVLSPDLPPCPPRNPFSHIRLLARVAFKPTPLDTGVLEGLREAEKTLRKGSKSFEVAKLAFGREMRLGLVVIYAWCRVTDNLIDEPVQGSWSTSSPTDLDTVRRSILQAIRDHLSESYTPVDNATCHHHPGSRALGSLPQLTASERSAFDLFSAIIPRLVPIDPFLELCDGYDTDMRFLPSSSVNEAGKLNEDIANHLPIKTTDDLMRYADDVAGSIASAICYLAWSLLAVSTHGVAMNRPVDGFGYAATLHAARSAAATDSVEPRSTSQQHLRVIVAAREMGRALQLVNISRDVARDAEISRLYVPLSFFHSASSLISVLVPSLTSPASYAPYTLPILDLADDMRLNSKPAISQMPRTARGGIRAMIASYFEIAEAVREQRGEVDVRGVKVGRWRRGRRAMDAMWLGR
ncbi:hypothetical protein IAR55_000191 [Kwoniella newhampshirensis]|uniref:Bifunctional lycopene cyclase/phytoene synthase n=1 Tax=Kwoniella newhampshirensis TaxID=1651941 RepID=A0AAW0Z6N2_9TREE